MTNRRRGEGSLYQRADGMWMGSVELDPGPDGRRRRRYVSSMNFGTAQRKLRDLRRTVEDHGGDLPTASMTVEAWLTYWLDEIASRHAKPRTMQGYRTTVHQHLIPHLGKKRLDKLAPEHVRAMHRALEQTRARRAAEGAPDGLAPTTILKAHRVLAKALTDAMREGKVHRNVATLVDAPRRDTTDQAALSTDQARALLLHHRADPLMSRWMAALMLGARQGELLGLTWDRVDLGAWTADLSWQLQRLPQRHGCKATCGRKRAGNCPDAVLDVPVGFECIRLDDGGLALTRPKSRAGKRKIPMPPQLVAALTERAAITAGWPNRHGLVWADSDGDPIDPSDDHQAWKDALAAAGLPPIKLHAARHTTASLLLELGVDAHVIASILGHSEIVTTRGYQHVDDRLMREAMGSLGGMLALPAAERPAIEA